MIIWTDGDGDEHFVEEHYGDHDPIIEGDELKHEADDGPVCDECNEPADRLTHIDDSDPSVGYYSELAVCDNCLRRRDAFGGQR